MKKRNVYFSWNAAEQARLLTATHDEIVMYLVVLKPLSDFKTGMVGTFAKAPLTLTRLGELMGRPETQGRAAVRYDWTEARRILERLTARGLVSDVVNVRGEALVLCLPLSPIPTAGNKPKLSEDGDHKSTVNPPVDALPEDTTDSRTVLTNIGGIDQSQKNINTDSPPQIEPSESSIKSVEVRAEADAATTVAADEDDDDENFNPFRTGARQVEPASEVRAA